MAAREEVIHVPKWLWALIVAAAASTTYDKIQVARLSDKLEVVNRTALALEEIRAERQANDYRIGHLSHEVRDLKLAVEKLRDELSEARRGKWQGSRIDDPNDNARTVAKPADG